VEADLLQKSTAKREREREGEREGGGGEKRDLLYITFQPISRDRP